LYAFGEQFERILVFGAVFMPEFLFVYREANVVETAVSDELDVVLRQPNIAGLPFEVLR